ncbi:hypothetical protein [Saccharothrix sp. ALI-22-I]|uniref:hypothetical protein n=1 Tax=Saccharothrix sp. ALI-22-I TaxID=1933778 RepID=UPI0015C3869E|nr:hypothetical protein [Saccharothrix sp. ALI-22-I]
MKPIALLCFGDALNLLCDMPGAKRAFRECLALGPSSSRAHCGYLLGGLLPGQCP